MQHEWRRTAQDGTDYMTGEEQRSGGAEARELPVVGACPDCSSALAREEGCVMCGAPGCGFSRCS